MIAVFRGGNMFALASKKIAKDVAGLLVALYLSSLLLFPGAMEMVERCGRECWDLAILSGTILVCSFFINFLHDIKGKGKSRVPVIVASMLLATTVLMLIYQKAEILLKNEELIQITVALFGLISLTWYLAETYWHVFPGMRQGVFVVGNGESAMQMQELILRNRDKYDFRGFILSPEWSGADRCSLSAAHRQHILDKARRAKVDIIVVSFTERRGAFPLQDMLNCKLSGMEILDGPAFYERVNRKLLLESINPSSFIFSTGFRITTLKRMVKRSFDIALSLVGLLALLPALPVVALVIKIDSRGPVLFRQVRVGEGDRDFVIYKFRTMAKNAERATGAVWSQKKDTRITKVGRFLRKTRIDELPQLINVLNGSMSLVGPRPERPEFVKELRKVIPYYSERHVVKPGVTGWAQVCYPYGSSVEDAVEKLRFDLYYIKKCSIILDICIMFKTVGVVLKKMGR